MKPNRDTPGKSDPARKISAEPPRDLRGSNSNDAVPTRKHPFVNHGLEESPMEARARFHSELLDRVRKENSSKGPAAMDGEKDLLETIDVWEQSLRSGVDEKPNT